MSLGTLFLCCERRNGEDADEGNGAEEVPVSQATCGVGINFRADKSGALFVSSLIPGGANPIPRVRYFRPSPHPGRSACWRLRRCPVHDELRPCRRPCFADGFGEGRGRLV